MRLIIESRPESPMQDRPTALHSSVSADYAKAIGMRVVAGRWVTDAERDPVFVVNESLARGAFPGEDPIGKRIQTGGAPGATAAAGAKFGTIVGVVADLKYTKLDESPEPEIFADYLHASPFTINFVVRTTGDPLAIAPTIRALVAGVDTAQTIADTRTVEAALSESIAPRRFTVFLLGVFAATALLLALIGIYGVIAYSVAQRTQEIGVRMALGAERRAVVMMVVRQGMSIAIAGLVLGVAAALALTRVMTGLLYEVTPTDPPTFAAVVGVLAATALAACCGPALKAARVDPLVALRHE
jgi:putative ABC transport system permease protein